MTCDWLIVETGIADGSRYSIHECLQCSREAVVIDGSVNLSQWQCPSDTAHNGDFKHDNSNR